MVKVTNISLWKEYFLLCKWRLICRVILVSLWMSCSLVTLPSVHNPCLSQLYWGGGGFIESWFLSFFPHILGWHVKKSFSSFSFTFFFTCHSYFIYPICYTQLYECTECSNCPKLGQWEPPLSWLFCSFDMIPFKWFLSFRHKKIYQAHLVLSLLQT